MASPAARTTFAAVPPEAADVLRPTLPGLADEMIAAIAVEVPDYARAMEGTFGQMVRHGVEVALNRFVDMVADPTADVTRARDTYVNLGRRGTRRPQHGRAARRLPRRRAARVAA